MSKVISEELRKVVLAGIGATAMTVEKSSKMIDEFIEKGALTVELGKTMNEELKHSMKQSLNPDSKLIRLDELEKLDEETIIQLKSQLDALEKERNASTKVNEKK